MYLNNDDFCIICVLVLIIARLQVCFVESNLVSWRSRQPISVGNSFVISIILETWDSYVKPN